MTILLMGILAGGSVAFITSSTQTYYDTAMRNQLSAVGRITVNKIERAINEAVPNSIRVRASTSNDEQCLEFLPAIASSYYSDAPFLSPGGTTVSVIHLPVTTGGAYAVIYPMAAADIYQKSNPGPLATVASVTAQSMTLFPSHQFSSSSPGNRIYYAAEPESYCLTRGKLYRYRKLTAASANYSIRTLQCLPSDADCLPTVPPDRALIADSIDNETTPIDAFEFQPAGLANTGLFRLNLNFSNGSEALMIRHEIQIKNVQ